MAAAKIKSKTTANSSKAPVKAAQSAPTKVAKASPSKAPSKPSKPAPSKAPPTKASKAPPARGKVAPPTKSVAPKSNSVAPPTKSVAPKSKSLAPKAGPKSIAPKSIAPKAASIKPSAKSIAPKAASIVPKSIAPKVTPAAAPLPERRSKIPPKFTVRSPADADERKARIGALSTAISQIKILKRTLSRSFMDVGAILVDIRDRKLFEVKGLSFESFVEREIELGKTMSLRLVRAVELFHKPAALAGGLDRVVAAVRAFDGDADPQMSPTPPGTSPGFVRSPIPFHKR